MRNKPKACGLGLILRLLIEKGGGGVLADHVRYRVGVDGKQLKLVSVFILSCSFASNNGFFGRVSYFVQPNFDFFFVCMRLQVCPCEAPLRPWAHFSPRKRLRATHKRLVCMALHGLQDATESSG